MNTSATRTSEQTLTTPSALLPVGRLGTWWAPGIALAVFGVMFTLSTVVIGPAISGRSPFGSSGATSRSPGPTPTAPISSSEHAGHHQP